MAIVHGGNCDGSDGNIDARHSKALIQAGALQRAIDNSAYFSKIATDAKGVIQMFNVGAERMLGYAAAEVINNITPADLPRIYERFWKADTSRQRDGEGSGLGLAIVRHVVEAHGGTVTVTSEPRRGTDFQVGLTSPPRH